MESFVQVTVFPSTACLITFFATCLTFDYLAADPERRSKYAIQEVSETKEKISEMTRVAITNLFGGMIVIFLLHPLSLRLISTDQFQPLIEFITLLLMLILADANFYWSHRLLHHPLFYTRCHKLHHTCKHPVPWTSLYVDYGEFVIAILSSFLLPLWVMPCFSLQPHYITYSLFLIFITFSLVMSHDGMNYPLLAASHHDRHHLYFTGNYGSRLNLWDWLMGTQLHTHAG